MESSGARPEHGPDKGHRGRCTRRQGISRPGSLSLSFSLLSSPLHSSPSAYTHKHTHTYESHGAQFRSVPFVRYERILCRFSPPLPSPRLTSPRLVSLLRSPHPLARCLGFANLATPCFHRLSLALTLTLSQTNVGFVVYTAGCTESNFVSFSL